MTAAYTSDELRCGYRVIQVFTRSVRIECIHCGECFSAERDGDAAAYESEPCVECGAILCPYCPAAKCEGCDVRQCESHLTEFGGTRSLNGAWIPSLWCKTCLAEVKE